MYFIFPTVLSTILAANHGDDAKLANLDSMLMKLEVGKV